MKKKTIQLFVIICLFVLVGCSQNNEQDEAESIVGYIVIKDNTLYIDRVEFLKHLDEYNLNAIPLSKQKIPYFIEVKNGKVISIEEKFEYTI